MINKPRTSTQQPTKQARRAKPLIDMNAETHTILYIDPIRTKSQTYKSKTQQLYKTTIMTSLNSTHDAIELNQQGVGFLQNGEFLAAVKSFSKSLSTIKGVLADYQESPDLVATEESDEDCSGSKFFKAQSLVFEFLDSATNQRLDLDLTEEKDSEPSTPFVFQRPITASYAKMTDRSSIKDVEFRSLVKFSSALLFNLALAYHLVGNATQDVNSRRKKLKKALTFYKLTYTMMQDSLDSGVTETLAIVNNLGHVQRSLGDLEKSKQCYEHLLSTIMYVADAGDRDAIQNFEMFFHSVQSTILAPPAPTAQAA